MSNLNSAGFITSSPVQNLAIPLILKGQDIFAQAETGSGKTGAFAIPIIQQMTQKSEDLCLVLSPTRELAQQTSKIFKQFGENLGVDVVNVIGGESISKQQKALKTGVNVIVGTPGRINDLARKRDINLKAVTSVVFDEADRLFDMGFKQDIEYILRIVPQERQMIMMSATTNQDVLRTAYRFKSRPEEIILSEDNLLVDHIEHSLVMLSSEEKFPYLVKLLDGVESSFIFCNTQYETHLVGEWLSKQGFKASYISGKLAQNRRSKLMDKFRAKEINHLVCTDVAARGLDINDIELVVNYQLPNEADNYVHRIGRTGRAGKDGRAISLCAYEDCENLEQIKTVIQEDIPVIDVTNEDFAKDICAKPKMDSRTLKVKDKTPTQPKQEKVKKEKKVKEKTVETPKSIPPFLVTAENFDSALEQALGHFQVKDPEMLENKVVKKTGKKFLMFGKEEITYEFVKIAKKAKGKRTTSTKKERPVQEKKSKERSERRMSTEAPEMDIDLTAIPAKLEPFIQQILEKMGLELTFEMEVQDRRVKVDIRGEDIGLVLTNKKQLMYALETVMRQFLFRRDLINRQSQLSVYAHGTNPKPQKAAPAPSRYDEYEEEENDNIGNREGANEREFRGEDYGEVKRARRPRRRNPNGMKASGNRASGNRERGGNRRGNGRRDNKPVNHTDEFLQDMARILRDQVLEEGESKVTKALNPYERRIIHEALHDDQRVQTQSEGDGKFKKIKISLIANAE